MERKKNRIQDESRFNKWGNGGFSGNQAAGSIVASTFDCRVQGPAPWIQAVFEGVRRIPTANSELALLKYCLPPPAPAYEAHRPEAYGEEWEDAAGRGNWRTKQFNCHICDRHRGSRMWLEIHTSDQFTEETRI